MTTVLSTMPQELNLNLYSGDGVTLLFNFIVDAGPWDTSGVWTAEVRRSAVADVITSFTIDNSVPLTGVVTASLSGAQVSLIGNEGVWDLQHVAPGAEPHTWYRGAITVTGDVTRG
jgi:hypothetical protein